MSATGSRSAMTSIRTRPRLAAGIAVAFLVVVSATVRVLLSRDVAGPWIFVDELIYASLGRTAYGGFELRGVPISGYGIGYPLVIAPAYALFEDLVTAYAAVKAINAVVMSLTVIPVYLITRTLLGRRWSLAAAALAVAVPSMGYTSVVMTESAFYPAFACTMLFVVYALGRGGWWWQALVFVGTFACFEIRPQGAVVVPAFLASIVLLVVFESVYAAGGSRFGAAWREVRRFWATWLIGLMGLVGLVAYAQARGGIGGLLGAYSITTVERDRYQLKPIISWFLLHIAELDLWVGVISFVALLVLLGVALSRAATRELRAFACAAVPIILLMTALVAAFVVFANVARIEERNLFYVGFLPLIALCWWASEGLRRPQPRWFVIAVAAGAIGPVILPYGSLLTTSAVSDTFGVFVPYAVFSRLGDATLTAFIVAAGVLVGIGLAALLPERRAAWAVVAVAAFLVITGIAVDRRTDKAAAAAQAISEPQNWIDRAVGADADVAILFQGGSDPLRAWQAEFFNRSPQRLLTLGTPLAGSLPDTVVNVEADGTVVTREGNPISARYVLTDALTAVAGPVVARDERFGMVLYEPDGVLRVHGTSVGVFGDGWTGPDLIYTRYACGGGVVTLEASVNASIHPSPVTVTPYVGETALPATQVDASVGSVPVPARVEPIDGVCQVRFNVTPLAVPAAVIGSSDSRQLGVIVRSIGYAPEG